MIVKSRDKLKCFLAVLVAFDITKFTRPCLPLGCLNKNFFFGGERELIIHIQSPHKYHYASLCS